MEKDIFGELKETLKRQIKDAYMEGVQEGAVITSATLYTVLINMGLEKDNIIFDILRDIAKRHGCEDLENYALKIKEEMIAPEDSYLN